MGELEVHLQDVCNRKPFSGVLTWDFGLTLHEQDQSASLFARVFAICFCYCCVHEDMKNVFGSVPPGLMHSPNCLLKKTNHGVLFTTLAEQQRAHRPAITVNASELDSPCLRQEVERCLVLLGELEGQIMSAMSSCVTYPLWGEVGLHGTHPNCPKVVKVSQKGISIALVTMDPGTVAGTPKWSVALTCADV